MSSTFEVVLFGASGFEGRLVAEYLARNGGGAAIAFAGRNRDKLERVRAEVGAAQAAILIADAADPAALRAIVDRAKVVCSTVGPYWKYGTPLVEQCVHAGVSYCDITGEVPWMREMIERFHGRAKETGARIVHCCGYDSIPSDLGVLALADHFERVDGRRLARARARVREKGVPSGGTVASTLGVMRAMRDPKRVRQLFDPYVLVPEPSAPRRPQKARLLPGRDADRGAYFAASMMSAVNTRVVHRTNALLGYRYGEGFEYEEAFDAGSGREGLLRAARVTLGLAGAIALSVTGLAALAAKKLPSPGEGPSREVMQKGMFRFEIHGESDADRGPPMRAVATIAGPTDPAHLETARMLGESALCLAAGSPSSGGGVLTPAAAMGMPLVERLRRAGLVFEVAPAAGARSHRS